MPSSRDAATRTRTARCHAWRYIAPCAHVRRGDALPLVLLRPQCVRVMRPRTRPRACHVQPDNASRPRTGASPRHDRRKAARYGRQAGTRRGAWPRCAGTGAQASTAGKAPFVDPSGSGAAARRNQRVTQAGLPPRCEPARSRRLSATVRNVAPVAARTRARLHAWQAKERRLT